MASRSVEATTSRRRSTCGRGDEVGGTDGRDPRAPSMSLCRTVEDEEEAGEVDADVEVEACGRRAVGDSISSSARVKSRGITKKTNQQQLV